MSFVPCVCDVNKWREHFKRMASNQPTRLKRFYVVGSGQGQPSNVVMVSPVQSDVARANSELKTDMEENISAQTKLPAHLPRRRRAGYIRKATATASKKHQEKKK